MHVALQDARPKRSRSKIGAWRLHSRERRSEGASGSGLPSAAAVFPCRDIREGVERVVRVSSPPGAVTAGVGVAAAATAGCAATAGPQASAATAGSGNGAATAGKGKQAAKAGERGGKGMSAATADEWLRLCPTVRDMAAAAGLLVRCVSFPRQQRGHADIHLAANQRECDYVLDCEIFARDPSATAGYMGYRDEDAAHRCCGANGNVLAGVVSDTRFPDFLCRHARPRVMQLIIDAAERWRQTGGMGQEITVGFRCRVPARPCVWHALYVYVGSGCV